MEVFSHEASVSSLLVLRGDRTWPVNGNHAEGRGANIAGLDVVPRCLFSTALVSQSKVKGDQFSSGGGFSFGIPVVMTLSHATFEMRRTPKDAPTRWA